MTKLTINQFVEMKKKGEKIVMLTGYDCGIARLLNEAEIDAILVGDSVGMVKLGFEDTLSVTMDDMLHHCRAVKRGNTTALIVADMPYRSYTTPEEAVANARCLTSDGGADAVKIEGGTEMFSIVTALCEAGIAVMGHLGLTPQSIRELGGYKVQGREPEAAGRLRVAARDLEKAGVFSIVLECIPETLAAEIAAAASIPMIGIGAGRFCDGQVLVSDDMLGLSGFKPKFIKQYAQLKSHVIDAFKQYRKDVKEGSFPTQEHSYK